VGEGEASYDGREEAQALCFSLKSKEYSLRKRDGKKKSVQFGGVGEAWEKGEKKMDVHLQVPLVCKDRPYRIISWKSGSGGKGGNLKTFQ